MKALAILTMVYMKANLIKTIVSVILATVCYSVSARTYLVSVGIADYSGFPQQINNLTLPTKDAQTIVDLYSKNTSVDYAILLNDSATKSKILKAIKQVFNKATKDDIVVFYFSGHGYPGGFCAYDGNLGYDVVRKAMSKSKSNNKMMFIDACRSGGMRVDATSAQTAITLAQKANVLLFLSSRNDENSIERLNMQNGLFTTYLQKGLRGNADENHDRIITAKELYHFVHEGVRQSSDNKQHPVMWGNFDDNMTVMEWRK
jgi:uncharacterized caspase-like protein